VKCTYCQADLSIGTRICKTCGHPASINPTLEDLYFSRLITNAPGDLVQKVRSAPYLAKEHRSVTAIMINIANLDVLNEELTEPERNSLTNTTLDRIAHTIYQFEGTIAKLWESSILAFFGAPITHEDDPLRAVHAANLILAELKTLSRQLEAKFNLPIQFHLLINTGSILIENIKSNFKFDFQSLDNTLEYMDLILRMAIPCCRIILFEDTYRFIKPFVKCSPAEEVNLTDHDVNLQLWQVNEVSDNNLMQQRAPLTKNAPMIGRTRELDLLLELSETVLAGLGRVGVILGEPGIGKSRLVLEWKRKLLTLHQPTQIRWIEARGLAFGRELAYHLLKSLVRAGLAISETESPEKVKSTLRHVLDDLLGIDKERLYLYLAHLMDLGLSNTEEEQVHQLNAQELRAQYLHALRALFRAIALEQPVIIVLEDLHWADASSVDLMIDLLPLTASSPILFCLVSRSERDAIGWQLIAAAREQIGPRLTEINLENLGETESQTLVQTLLEIEELPDIIRKMVLEKSEGNPYFIEELVRMLINENVLTRKNDVWAVDSEVNPNKIPDSIQGLLIARIDRLPPEARMTLRVASVIGRHFPERVIERVLKAHSEAIVLMEQLSVLESIGMIRVAQVNPELSYAFQHILLHDAAYRSIVDEDRGHLHLTVGQVLEELYPKQYNRLASQLAHHFLEGQDNEKAFIYFDIAGHVAMDSFANVEAEHYFDQAIKLTEDREKLAHLYADLGESLAQQSKHREAVRAWEQAITHYRELNAYDRLGRIYAWSARSAWWTYDPKRSLEICLEGLEAVENAVESPDIAYLIHETGRAYLFNNEPEKAQSYCEQALEMSKRLNAYDVQAESLATIGILPNVKPQQAVAALEMAVKISESHNLYGPASRAYINLAAVIDKLGDVRLAREYRNRAIQLGNKAGGVTDETLVQQAIINASLWLGDFDDARQRIERMRQYSRQNDSYLEESTLDQIYLEGLYHRLSGNFSNAIEIFTDLIDRSRQTNDLERHLHASKALAEIILESNFLEDSEATSTNLEITFGMINEIVQSMRQSKLQIDAATQCLLSDIHALKGNWEKAEEALAAADRSYRAQPDMQDRVRIVLSQARLEISRENYDDALTSFEESLKMLETMEGRWWRIRALLEMGISHLKRNDPEDIDQAQNIFRESLTGFNELGVRYYPDLIIDKLRQVKQISRAQAIAHRKVTQELVEAGRVQHTFIPTHSPDIPGYQISGVLLPAHETSGDFYDFIDQEDGKLRVVIADVGDKGAGAALYMAMSRTLIRTYSSEGKHDPETVISEVNRRILSDTQRGIFLTAIYGVLNPEDSSFTYVNAGHNPPCILHRAGDEIDCQQLEKTGTLVGIFPDNTWEAKTVELQPGETLVLYTDGITEAQNEAGEFFGYERLLETLKTGFDHPAEDFRNMILENVQAFTGSAPRLDDITLIVIHKE